MRILGVGIEAADSAFQGVADFNVHRTVDTLHGNLAALAAVFRGVDGHGRRDPAGRRSFPVVAAAHDGNAVKDQHLQVAVVLHDGDLDEAVVHRPGRAVVRDGHRGVDVGLGDRRQGVGGAEHRYGQGQGNEGKEEEAARADRTRSSHGRLQQKQGGAPAATVRGRGWDCLMPPRWGGLLYAAQAGRGGRIRFQSRETVLHHTKAVRLVNRLKLASAQGTNLSV